MCYYKLWITLLKWVLVALAHLGGRKKTHRECLFFLCVLGFGTVINLDY
jgi:hypothetical protein